MLHPLEDAHMEPQSHGSFVRMTFPFQLGDDQVQHVNFQRCNAKKIHLYVYIYIYAFIS